MVDEVGAIAGGCVAGGLVFLAILGIVMYHVYCKRKHRKRRDQNKFRPISPHASPTHSQPSTLGPDGRLPKVNSTGLWVGAPSMYTGVAPSPAYYYGPGKLPSKQVPPHAGMIPRASSETRIPSSGLHYASPKPMYGSHGNFIIMPIMGMQPRIYHSAQPLAPVFEVPPPSKHSSGLEIYDVYQFGGGNSRSKLVEEKHSKNYYDEFLKPTSKLARSKSDIQENSKKLNSRNSRSRNSSASSKPAHRVTRSPSSTSGERVHKQNNHRPAPSPPRPSSSSVILQQHRRKSSNSKESRFASSAPGYRIGMKSKSLDSLDDNLSRSSFGGSHYNKAFDSGGLVSSVSGEIILKPAAPIPPKVAVVAAAPTVLSSSTPCSDIILPNGVISGNVSKSQDKDKNSNDIIIGENEAQIDTSATDSMKLLAKNKTDDQKTVVAVSPSPDIISKLSSSNSRVNDVDDKINDVIDIVEDKDISEGHVHYIYQGDIYAVPDKNGKSQRDDNDGNPIISRMKDMVVEKTRTNSYKSVSSPRSQSNKENEGPQTPTNNTPRYMGSDSIVIDTEYSEIGDIVKSMENINSEDAVNKDGTSIPHEVMGLANDSTQNDLIQSNDLINDIDIQNHLSKSSNRIGATLDENRKNIENGGNQSSTTDAVDGMPSPTSPVYLREHSSSSKADTTFEEINTAGKRITDSAFEFLNTYLSDDEGGDGKPRLDHLEFSSVAL